MLDLHTIFHANCVQVLQVQVRASFLFKKGFIAYMYEREGLFEKKCSFEALIQPNINVKS